VEKDVRCLRQPGCWLRSSHSFKECVTAHWSIRLRADILRRKYNGAQTYNRSSGFSGFVRGAVEEHSCQRRSHSVSEGGATGRENVGMSNDKPDEKSGHRKPKVSHATIIDVGLVGPKVRPKGVADGEQVNIPAPVQFRPSKPC